MAVDFSHKKYFELVRLFHKKRDPVYLEMLQRQGRVERGPVRQRITEFIRGNTYRDTG